MHFLSENVLEVWCLVCKAVEAHIKHQMQLFSVNQRAILNFQTPFVKTRGTPWLKHLSFPYFPSDSIENRYADQKHIKVGWYEISYPNNLDGDIATQPFDYRHGYPVAYHISLSQVYCWGLSCDDIVSKDTFQLWAWDQPVLSNFSRPASFGQTTQYMATLLTRH